MGGLGLLLGGTAPDAGGGHALLIAASAVWAATIVAVRGLAWHASPLALAPWQLALAGLIQAPLAVVFDPAPALGPGPLAAILWNGALGTGFAVWAAVTLNRAWPAGSYALALLAVPALATALGHLVRGEPVSAAALAALALVTAGNALALGDSSRRSRGRGYGL
jgi:drug/metabolite transporter (DMT)-like permease